MNVIETKSQGLSREYKVSVPASELAAKLADKIEEIRPKVQLKGFRPGKVPAAHIRKMFGRSLMGEIVEETLQQTSQKALNEQALRPAAQPSIHLESAPEAVMSGEVDLEYHIHVEVMPEFEPADLSEVAIERLVAAPEDADVDDMLKRLAENNKRYEARGKTAKARPGDAVKIDFVGKIDGETFEGGSAEGLTLVLGEGRFIPGFEDQLIGAKAGEDVEVNVAFPADYPVDTLAGKAAVFEVKVAEVQEPVTPEIDEAFAKTLGMDSVEALRAAVVRDLESEIAAASRQHLKRRLLDALDERHAFDLPGQMVEAEFNQIWSQIEQEKASGGLSREDAGKSDDELKAEYRKIAERRVRLGLVLAEIGQRGGVEITAEESAEALRREVARYPGQQKMVIDYFRQNPAAMAQLRAPIYEEKVVDHLLRSVRVVERTVPRQELLAEVTEA